MWDKKHANPDADFQYPELLGSLMPLSCCSLVIFLLLWYPASVSSFSTTRLHTPCYCSCVDIAADNCCSFSCYAGVGQGYHHSRPLVSCQLLIALHAPPVASPSPHSGRLGGGTCAVLAFGVLVRHASVLKRGADGTRASYAGLRKSKSGHQHMDQLLQW